MRLGVALQGTRRRPAPPPPRHLQVASVGHVLSSPSTPDTARRAKGLKAKSLERRLPHPAIPVGGD
eukprot:1116140-Pyramimonas_sp.AAC.1